MNLPDLPRLPLVLAPTPLVPAPRLSEILGLDVWFKRDDLTGRGLGGNKVRPLEYLLGDAKTKGCDALVTGAGPQSNWAMLAALTAHGAGIAPHLVFYGDPQHPTGNLLLAQLAGADIHYTGELDRGSVDPALFKAADELTDAGHLPYVVPRGGATPIGCLGYVRATAELLAQLAETGLSPASIWLATGSGGTQAGLVAGAQWSGWEIDVIGITTSRSPEEAASRVRDLASATLDLIGVGDTSIAAPQVRGGYLGEGYGKASPAGAAAAQLVAQTEGVFLDPAFGAKAMAALIDAARDGTVEGPVVFLVTGGAPTLFTPGAQL
ncbi:MULTISPECIES: pyridoxal-phosphate dependent enzyme [unclassified Nocardioides]|uniref:1-aminocyclopropane-1-carboxylate deaminase/D-cysteine desulfhydrase n=1 Tax=unclassified Nocardioides TaxID=2615069 RepID=UPI0000465722|nr:MULTISPECIES: pyridoxal-phosphate dependent enzyme [unclassified Nocardioides]AAV52073.1 putative 1-aminocyclopropane-1-carboxylate deaminase [Nocardioides sp. JS614]ABL79403.1 D-cysteine desulfhydrase [Nocardioides sp. JS614]